MAIRSSLISLYDWGITFYCAVISMPTRAKQAEEIEYIPKLRRIPEKKMYH
jgi:hypothetical protein